MDSQLTQRSVSRQAQILGYKDGDVINVRAIAGKGFDVKADGLYPFDGYLTVGTWEFTRLKPQSKGGGVSFVSKNGIDCLLRENLKGYGIYLIPNKGGRKDDQITEVTSLFYECDDIDKLEQFDRTKRLALNPSMIVETRNSLHVYYTLADGDRQVEGWRKNQQRLIQLMESDRSVHNESRLMRLAGFFHQKKGEMPLLVDIVQDNSNRYTLADFDRLLPSWDEKQWSDSKGHDIDWQEQVEAFKAKKRVLVPNDEAFPLEICLPHKDRELIKSGAAVGEGNTLGFKLACNLIATEDFLRSAGYQFIGDAETLFREFAYNSESYKTEQGIQRPWNSALKRRPTPTLTPQMIENCINAWRVKTGKHDWFESSVDKVVKSAKGVKDNGHEAFLNLTTKIFGGKTGLARHAKRIAAGLIKSTVNHFYEPGFGAKMYEELARQGHKWILDISGTGCGKTFTVSLLNKAAMFLQPDEGDEVLTRLFYMPPSYRNPTNAKIEEEWHETAARNNGLYLNYSKQTELGNPYRESLKDLGEVDDHERTQSNCHKAEIFHKHYAAGRSTEGLCKTCDVREKCAVKKGDGFGYISEVKKWVTQDKIRTSYQWLDKEKVSICSTGLLFDEAGQVGWSHQITVELGYIDKLMNKIRRVDSKLHRRLIDLQYAIADLVDSEEYPRHGYNKHQVMKALNVDKSLESDLEKILEIELDGRDNESEDVDPIFLYDLLRVALGLIPGSLSLSKNTLTIQIKNDRLIQACHAAKFVICQDATWSASMMAMALGIKESDIVVIAQRQEIPTNLVIEHWKGAGLLGNTRSESMQKLTRAIREQLMMMYPEIGFIDWKQHGMSSDLIHFGDSRGSNAYKEKSVVASIGLCRPNMTAVLLEYEVMSGRTIENFEDEGFREYYGHAIAANLIQEIGRLRANRRPGEELKFILIGDGDIQFLEDLGFDLVECDAATKLEGVELGAVGAKARYLNFGMRICRLIPKGEWRKMSLRKAAEFLDRAGSSVSRWVRRWFGVEGDGNGIAFQRFKELVYAAIYGGKTDGFSEAEETNIACLGEMLKKAKFCGQELGNELNLLIESCTWRVFLESVRRLGDDYGIKLLARIFDVAINAQGHF